MWAAPLDGVETGSQSGPRAGAMLVLVLLLLFDKNFAFHCDMFYVQGQTDFFSCGILKRSHIPGRN